ncbi:MAG TPA: hypothetical protein VG318_09300 [Actinomycetota bacterium]|nr:hypothetical protein [Actinomycetota bacterium]
MKKRLGLGLIAGVMAVGMLPGTASAGQYCERADEVATEAGFACRAGLGLVLDVCSKVTEKWGNECQLA